MKIKVVGAEWAMDERGTWLRLLCDDPVAAKRFCGEKKDRPYIADIQEYRKPRSLNANAYMWELLGKLSDVIHIPANDLYRQYVREMGVYRAFEIQEGAIGTLEYVWSARGLGWFLDVIDDGANDGFKLVKVYYGSSSYNTKQMAALIDAVVQDCKALGIETETPDEIARLVSLLEREA